MGTSSTVIILAITTVIGDPEAKLALWAFMWPFLALSAPTFFATIWVSVRAPRKVSTLWVATNLAIIVVASIAAATSSQHDYLVAGIRSPLVAGSPVLAIPGPLGYVLLVHLGVLLAAGCWLLIRASLHAARIYRRAIPVVFLAIGVPILAAVPGFIGNNRMSVVAALTGLTMTPGLLMWIIAKYPELVQRRGFITATREAVIEMIPEGVLVIDGGGLVIDENPSALRLLGIDRTTVGTRPENSLPDWLNEYVATAAGGDSTVVHRLNDEVTLDLTITHTQKSVWGGGGDAIVVIRDGSDRAHAEARLEFLAMRDPLTGLHNRAQLDHELEQRLDDGSPQVLMLLDVNDFKAINDTYGHASGDDLLRDVAQRLDALEIAGGFVARLGGDEFVVLAPISDHRHAEDLACQVAQVFDRDLNAGGHLDVRVGASIGVSIVPLHGTTSADVLRCADVAMYQAKRAGNRIQVYDPKTDPNTPERVRHLSDLRGAVERGEMVLHYQPVFDLVKDRASGVEALLRWEHPTRGLLYPSSFIGDVEEAGVGAQIARWVAATCLADRAAWPVGPEGFQVAFNLTVRDLADRAFVDDLIQIVTDSGIDTSEVIVEVTEMVNLSDQYDMEEHRSIQRLRDLGVRLVLDDFGTGHASVTMLRDLGGSVAKIAGEFIVQMRNDRDDLALVQGLTNLALHLNYNVLAEWVEDEETLVMVRELGCRFAQGFHLARPMSNADLVAWMPGNAHSLPEVAPVS